MDKYIKGQSSILKKDTNIIIDDEENCRSERYKINKGTKFIIEDIEEDGWFKIKFEGVGIATFSEAEMNIIM